MVSLKRKRERLPIEGSDPTIHDLDEEVAEAEPNDPDREAAPAKKRNSAPRSIFVRSLPNDVTTESLAEHFSQSYPLRHATVVLDPTTKKSKGFGFVTFADAEDAQRAKEEFNGTKFNGKQIKVEIAEPRKREMGDGGASGPKKSKPSAEAVKAKEKRQEQLQGPRVPKLIIRNLPWSVKTSDDLALLFRSYGKVKIATMPKTKPGLSSGFGFVLLRGMKNAEKALAGVNGKVVDGRTLAVDWAVEKDVWQATQKKEGGAEDDEDASLKSEEEEEGIRLDEIPPSDAEHDDFDDDEEDDEEEEDDDDDEMITEDELDEDDEEDEPRKPSDNSSTLFIRNLPFTITDETLAEHFKQFGAVRYARIVMDRETERPRGTGFVCFYNVEDAVNCLRATPKTSGANAVNATGKASVKHSLLQDTQNDPQGRFTVDGRVLQVSKAVDRNEAQRLTTEGSSLREARDKDKRRLYLLSEGTVSANSPLYAHIAPSEMKMREESAKQRQSLIKSNPSLHLSLTRLSVRNLPRHVTSKDLKQLAREAVVRFAADVKESRRTQLSTEELSRGGEEMKEAEKSRKAKGKGIVKQSKVVFEGREGGKVDESSGAGRSRGYGFVEFTSHRWALMGLRSLNGFRVEPPKKEDSAPGDVKEKAKRVIVEFAIENAQVVSRRKDREQKARERSSAVVESRKSGETAKRQPKKALSKDALMKKTRVGSKRKRGDGAAAAQTSDGGGDGALKESEGLSKIAKRQKIIGRKRSLRKSKRQG